MPTYKLYYFDARARAEICRLVVFAAGKDKDFEDVRVQREEWPALKPKAPFGQMPFLEAKGKCLAQSRSIARYLAREFGLAGGNSWEQGQVDQYVELHEDMFKEFAKMFFEEDATKKAELEKQLENDVIPKFMGFFENGLEKNFLVGSKLTLADLAAYNASDVVVSKFPNCLEKFPKLKALRNRIETETKLKDYLKNRKASQI